MYVPLLTRSKEVIESESHEKIFQDLSKRRTFIMKNFSHLKLYMMYGFLVHFLRNNTKLRLVCHFEIKLVEF